MIGPTKKPPSRHLDALLRGNLIGGPVRGDPVGAQLSPLA